MGELSIYVELQDSHGLSVRGLPDPSGGTFDAAGDFDRFINDLQLGLPDDPELPILGAVDPNANTEMNADRMPALLKDISKALLTAKPGRELRGLQRLKVLAEECAKAPDRTLVWLGD